MEQDSRPPSLPLVAIAVVSAAALAYEVLLTRLFAVIQWHHFAHMVISLALLGYGASGACLALTVRRMQRRFALVFAANALLFGASALGGFLLIQALPLNPLELLWDPAQTGWLALTYLVLAVPFFFAANCIGLSLYRFPAVIPRLYAFDLLGAGAGSLVIVLLLYAWPAPDLLLLVGAGGLLGAIAVSPLPVGLRRVLGAVSMLAVVGIAASPQVNVSLRPSPYKGLSQALEVAGSERLQEHWSPLGMLTVVASPKVPFRHAPGLSLMSTAEPPPQLAVFTDAGGMTAVNRFDGDWTKLEYLREMTSAAPFSLLRAPRVLVLAAGGGSDVLQALLHGATGVDAVELNPQLIDLVNTEYGEYSGKVYGLAGVRVYEKEARGFIAGNTARYDLIELALVDSFGPSSAGLYALSESYLYTVEALRAYLGRLAPGGLLAITRWVKLPPRDGLKLFATALEALDRSGIDEPGQRLAWIRGWNTSTLLVKAGPFTSGEVVALRRFCEERGFDTAYFPGIQAEDANRHNLLPQPFFYAGAVALLEDAEGFIGRNKFDIRPATDDRPYFFNFFRWTSLPELVALRGQGGVALLDSGYLMLVITLGQALLASVLFIGVPAWYQARRGLQHASRRTRAAVLGYFLAVGLAFLFMEIAYLQRFILFLAHPVYAVSVVLAGFLVFAGLGSRQAQRLWAGRCRGDGGSSLLQRVVAGIAILALVYAFVLPHLLEPWMAWPEPLKILATLMLISPLAFLMGLPFPLVLAGLGRRAKELIPWAWAINGCASVLSAVLATMLAIHWGFTAVVLAAVVLYAAAGWLGSPLLRN
jgi:hypothetical protein